MKVSARKLHRVVALAVALPVFVILVSGIILQLRQDWTWVQPKAVLAEPGLPTITIQQAYAIAQAVPEAGIQSWDDIASFDVRFRKGTISVRSENGYEVQINGKSGEVLSAAPRRTSLLIELHQGSFFHPWVMKGVFLPAGLGLLVLWFSGLRIFFRKRPVRKSS